MECCGYLINDHHLGEEICENCGKSISTIYSDNTFVEEEDDFIEYLDNVCANNHISKIISDEAKTIFNKNNNDKSKEYLAYCLYQASIIHDAGRTLQEISKMFGISSTSIAKKEKNTWERNISIRSCISCMLCYKYDTIQNPAGVEDLFK